MSYISDTLGCAELLNRRTTTWNLFVKYKYVNNLDCSLSLWYSARCVRRAWNI